MCILLKTLLTLLLVILKLCNSASGQNFSLKSMDVICSIYNYTNVPTPPVQCTAMVAYTSVKDQVDGANKMRGKLPLLIIVDTFDPMTDHDAFKKDPADVLKDFKQIKFDCMAIDNAYRYTYFETTAAEIATFFDKAKKAFPGKGFGLALDQSLWKMKRRLDIPLLNKHVDFFLLNTTNYNWCLHHNKQGKQEVPATKELVLGSLNLFKETQPALDKVIFSIDLRIESIKPLESDYAEMDFPYLCTNKLSKYRKYCYSSIKTLFDIARLRISERTAGILVRGIDYDDYSGKCGCVTSTDSTPTFRGLKTVAGACHENKNDVSFYDCVEGAYPVILDE